MVLKKYISRQPAVRIAASWGNGLIDLVLGNKSGTLLLKSLCQREYVHGSLEPFQPPHYRKGAVEMEPEDIRVFGVCGAKFPHFFRKSGCLFRGLQHGFQLLCRLRESAPFHVNLTHQGEQPGLACRLAKILAEIPEALRQFVGLIVPGLCGTLRGEVSAVFHQAADTAFHLCPG